MPLSMRYSDYFDTQFTLHSITYKYSTSGGRMGRVNRKPVEDADMGEMTSINIDYKHVEGWHVFSSTELPGLYVASMDAREAYEDVAPSLEKLLKLNAGITCSVKPECSFEEFLKQHTGSQDKSETVPVLRSQRYAVYACQ